jgi:predicted DNA-binding transcriptional regulator AlpA
MPSPPGPVGATDGTTPAHRPGDRLLTPAQVAAILGGNTTAYTIVRRWRQWNLPAVKIGRELRFWESDLYQWIRSRQASTGT